jgi:hypothetical protein
MERVLGCDFGAPLRAGDQAKKNIVIEAVRSPKGEYAITPHGLNRVLVEDFNPLNQWYIARKGWTIPGLLETLLKLTPSVAAFDFPFSIPVELLESVEFAAAVGAEPFRTRAKFVEFVQGRLSLDFDSDKASAEMSGLRNFDGWKQSKFWLHRATDGYLNGAPPLKNVPPNVFNMTLAGAVMVQKLVKAGFHHALQTETPQLPALVETYYSGVTKVIGADRYTAHTEIIELARQYLTRHGVRLTIHKTLRRFILDYRTSGDDPDGLDAFLCLITAIAYREGFAEAITAGASPERIHEEGVVILPKG